MTTIHLNRRGDYYNAYHQDATDLSDILGDVALTVLGGAKVAAIPRHALLDVLDVVTAAGHSVKINRVLRAAA